MSTNYYAACPNRMCGCEVHLGKVSGGWRFLARAYSPTLRGDKWAADGYSSWLDLIHQLVDAGFVLRDEYGSSFTLDELQQIILRQQAMQSHTHDGVWESGPIDMLHGEFF